MRTLFPVVLLVFVVGCAAQKSADRPVTVTVEESATPATSEPLSGITVESLPPTTIWPALNEVEWLSTPAPVDGVRLVSATRQLRGACGPDGDCLGTIPTADMAFGTHDLDANRSLAISQFFDDQTIERFDPTAGAAERVLGSRKVTIVEDGTSEVPYIVARWDEPDGYSVELTASGLSVAVVEALIVSLQPTAPEEWPLLEVQERLTPCVDSGAQYAPSIIPPGWNRFVLEAQPTGTCGVSTVLFMSLVEPGRNNRPGKLVTFVSAAASTTTPQPGEPIEINGHPAVVQETTNENGTASTVVYLTIGDIVIDGHGNVDRATLESLMASITALDDQQWAQLISEIDNG